MIICLYEKEDCRKRYTVNNSHVMNNQISITLKDTDV